jgi:hypothetical protein
MIGGCECSEGTYCLPLHGRNTSTSNNEFLENLVVIPLVKKFPVLCNPNVLDVFTKPSIGQ